MNFIMTVFGYPFGWLMYGLYHLVSNYGVALVLFTLIVKLLLFPLGLKQQKSTVKMQIIQPKIQEIQAKYKNNQAKMNEELQALYSKENYNPMSGCGTLLIQFPVIFGLLDVVYKPLTHLLRFSKETITALTEVAGTLGIATTGYAPQINIYQSVMQNPAAYSSVGADVIAKIQSLDMGFLGMDLSGTPNLPWQGGWNWLVIIPLLSGLTALLSSIISMKNSPNMGQAGASMKMMMYIMPLISIWFTFMVPIGVGIYWTLSNVFGCVQCGALQAGGAAIQGGQLQLPDPEIIGDLAHFAAAQLLYPFEYIGKRIHIEPHFICIPGFPQGINTYFI